MEHRVRISQTGTVGMLKKSWLTTQISQRFPLSEAATAQRALKGPGTTGQLLRIP